MSVAVARRPFPVLLALSLALNALVLVGAGVVVHRKGGLAFLRAKYYETFVENPYSGPSTPVHESTTYRREVSVFDLASVRPGDVVLLGDSHIQFGLWSEVLGSVRVRNRGIAGDNTEGVLSRLDPIVAGRPAAVFLAVGSNDVDARYVGASVEATVPRVMEIVDRIRRGSPGTAVYVLSAPPKSRNTTLNATETPLAHQLNARFAALAPQHGATYVDIATPLQAADGSMEIAYTYDGGHLNGEGYRRVADVLRPLVAAHLAGAPAPAATAADAAE
jgi:lysophospholipase L1-like esterase